MDGQPKKQLQLVLPVSLAAALLPLLPRISLLQVEAVKTNLKGES